MMTDAFFSRWARAVAFFSSLVTAFSVVPSLANAADAPQQQARPAISGTISDQDGNPLPGASVTIWKAAPKRGYSTYCPSCYADCGKRAGTGAKGEFSFERVDPTLRFELLVVREGFAPLHVEKVEPFGRPVAARLMRRDLPTDPSLVLHGRILASNRRPAANAVVDPEFVSWKPVEGTSNASWGHGKDFDPLVVSNDQGEFDVVFKRPAQSAQLCVYARGMAPKWFDLPTGPERHTLRLQEGAMIRGRLVQFGKPVGDAEIGLIKKDRNAIGFFPEARIATDPNGRFLFTNVPVPNDWFLYAKMDSISNRGATVPISCHTIDGDEIDLGDVQVTLGNRVRGRVILTDGKPIPDGMQIRIGSEEAWDDQAVSLPANGRFEFKNVPTGEYHLAPAVKGYYVSNKNPNFQSGWIEGRIDRNFDDFILLLDAGEPPFRGISERSFGKPLLSAKQP